MNKEDGQRMANLHKALAEFTTTWYAALEAASITRAELARAQAAKAEVIRCLHAFGDLQSRKGIVTRSEHREHRQPVS